MTDQPVSENQALRYRRLAFYAEDVANLNEVLSAFVKKSSARCALLIDKDGHLVAKQGFLQDIDGTSLAALVAGSFASTREVARQLGEHQFDVLFHQGRSESIHIRLIGDRTLQVAVFDSNVRQGMIQVFAGELATRVEAILDDIARRAADGAEEDERLATGFSREMQDHLDNLFGDL